MAKHFPGPWIVGPVDDTLVRAVTTEGEYYTICEMDGNYNDPHQWPVMEANARLIAAAPDLLEALRLHKAWAESEKTGPDYQGMTRDTHPNGHAIWSKWWNDNLNLCDRANKATDSAIAKAEGKS